MIFGQQDSREVSLIMKNRSKQKKKCYKMIVYLFHPSRRTRTSKLLRILLKKRKKRLLVSMSISM
jgi:hypothetical protein